MLIEQQEKIKTKNACMVFEWIACIVEKREKERERENIHKCIHAHIHADGQRDRE